MRVDYHVHTRLCKHAIGEVEDYVRRALALGLDEIGFSDHNPMPGGYDDALRMGIGQLPEYAALVARARAAFPKFPIRFGIEADFHDGTEDWVRASLAPYALDYVIGSVHFLGTWGFDNPDHVAQFDRRDIFELYEEYFAKLARAAASGLFDVIGHPDVIKKFGHRPARDVEPLYRRVLGAISAAGLALDVNTSGLRKPVREIYPTLRFLQVARSLDVPVTLGSDAHEPGHVGEDFDRAVELLTAAGYNRISVFEARRRHDLPLG